MRAGQWWWSWCKSIGILTNPCLLLNSSCDLSEFHRGVAEHAEKTFRKLCKLRVSAVQIIRWLFIQDKVQLGLLTNTTCRMFGLAAVGSVYHMTIRCYISTPGGILRFIEDDDPLVSLVRIREPDHNEPVAAAKTVQAL
jgi:hypothetical protein